MKKKKQCPSQKKKTPAFCPPASHTRARTHAGDDIRHGQPVRGCGGVRGGLLRLVVRETLQWRALSLLASLPPPSPDITHSTHSRRHRPSARGSALVDSPARAAPRAYSPPRTTAPLSPPPSTSDRDPLLAHGGTPSLPQPFDRPLARGLQVPGGSSDGDDDDNVCPTCLSRFTPANPKTFLDCGHAFHLSCHLEWEERCGSVGAPAVTCPVCAAPTRESVG